MKTFAALILLAFTAAAFAQTPDRTWILDHSTLSYHMSHPMHEVDGTTHSAKGKGFCHAGTCNFLVAALVKSFDSGDTNRDEHMLQVTRGADFPVVTVRFQVPEADTHAPIFTADLDVSFAGQTAHYHNVAFQQQIEGQEHHITGVVPATVSDFKIIPPSFLTVPIRNEIPVKVDTYWHEQ